MAVTLTRKPFSAEEIAMMTDAVMSGGCIDGWPELEEVAIEIAERLPALLKKAGLPDTSDNRRAIVRLVMVRWGAPKSQRPSRSFRKFARRR